MREKKQDEGPAGFVSRAHDHQRCIDEALDKAAELCRGRGARLTELRRRVLELVWRRHEPVGAYAILEELQRSRAGAAPPTVYRALDFLLAQGLIHRIASLNAFIGCPTPDRRHSGQFMICSRCGRVAEIDDSRVGSAIARSAASQGFTVDRLTVELQGRCPACREAAAHAG